MPLLNVRVILRDVPRVIFAKYAGELYIDVAVRAYPVYARAGTDLGTCPGSYIISHGAQRGNGRCPIGFEISVFVNGDAPSDGPCGVIINAAATRRVEFSIVLNVSPSIYRNSNRCRTGMPTLTVRRKNDIRKMLRKRRGDNQRVVVRATIEVDR